MIKMKRIPVAMATDDDHIPLVTALTSLAENAAQETFYDVSILTGASFRTVTADIISRHMKKYEEHCSISFLDVGDIFKNAPIRIRHITQPTYYRLILPQILDRDKCIYLDTDTIVRSDLQELFQTSLDGCYIGGVRHPGVIAYGWEDAVCRNADIPSAEGYINAGILVMDLAQMRRDGMSQKCVGLIPRDMVSQDQDIINHVFYGKMKMLPLKYNVMAKLAGLRLGEYQGCYPAEEILEAWNDPCIIHYAGPCKPWNSTDGVFMDQWWQYFQKSGICGCGPRAFFQRFITKSVYPSHTGQMFCIRLPQLFDLTYRRRYVVYGAGKRAREIIASLKGSEIYPEFIIVSQKKGNPEELDGIKVREIKEVGGTLGDKTIIIAVREAVHAEIIEGLQGYRHGQLLPLSDRSCMDEALGDQKYREAYL